MKNILLILTAAPLLLNAAVIYETDFASAENWTPWKISKESLRFGKDGFTVELKQRNNGFSGIRREIPVQPACGRHEKRTLPGGPLQRGPGPWRYSFFAV